MNWRGGSHHKSVYHLGERKLAVTWAVELIRELYSDHAVAVCGQSGIIVGTLVTDQASVPLVTVRKPRETTHAGYGNVVQWTGTDGEYGYDKPEDRRPWVFLDDLISQGRTLEHVCQSMKATGWPEMPTAILLHHSFINRTKYSQIKVHDRNGSKTA